MFADDGVGSKRHRLALSEAHPDVEASNTVAANASLRCLIVCLPCLWGMTPESFIRLSLARELRPDNEPFGSWASR